MKKKSIWAILAIIVAIFLFLGLLLLAGIGIYLLRQPAQQVEIEVEDSSVIRIPGEGSQKDYEPQTGRFVMVKVHDDEEPNENGFYDRTLVSSDPEGLGLNDEFSLPQGWTLERDFSLREGALVNYFTVKPPVGITEEIQGWLKINGLDSYEITSVIVIDGQECSVRGLDENRVRTNIYVGEDWAFQVCATSP